MEKREESFLSGNKEKLIELLFGLSDKFLFGCSLIIGGFFDKIVSGNGNGVKVEDIISE